MNETYQSIGYQNDSLMHHGVPGMRWGHRKNRIRTGIQRVRASIKASEERRAKAKMEKLEKKMKLAEIKNRIKTAKITNKNERSKIKSEILNRKIKDKEREREYKEKEFESSDNSAFRRKEKGLLLEEKKINMKQNKLDREHKRLMEKKTVSSGNRNSGSTAANTISPIAVYKNRASFTDEELSQALRRMTTEKQIRALAAEEIEAKRNPVVKFATKYAGKAVDQAMTNIINKGVTAATNGLMTKLLGQKDQENKQEKKQEKKSESSSSPVKSAYETVRESVKKVKATKVNPKDIPKYDTDVPWRTVETAVETVSSTPIWELVKRLESSI